MLTSFITPAIVLAMAQPTTAILVQKTSGWCSPNIANVVGKVSVNCIGVDPRALKRLNIELSKKQLAWAQELREANEWANRYKELEAHLSDVGDDDALSQKAQEYLHEGNLEKAGAILDQLLGREEKELDQVAANNYNRALVFSLQFQPLQAIPYYQKAYNYRPANPIYGMAYADLLFKENDFAGAQPVYEAVLAIRRDQVTSKPEIYNPDLAVTLNRIGSLYRKMDRFDDSFHASSEALNIYTKLAAKNPDAYQPYVAMTLRTLGVVYDETGRLELGGYVYAEALKIYRSLAKADPQTYLPDLASILNNHAETDIEFGPSHGAIDECKEALQIRRDLAKSDPLLYQPDVAATLNTLGDAYTDDQNLKEAEAAYTEALQIRTELVKENPQAYRPDLAATMNGLGKLYTKMHRTDDAMKAYGGALQTYRDLVKASPQAFQPDLARTLNNLGDFYFETGRSKDATDAYTEAMQIRIGLVQTDKRAFIPGLVDTLNNLVTVYKAEGKDTEVTHYCGISADYIRQLPHIWVLFEPTLNPACNP